MALRDTIAAVSTAPGLAGLAVLRVSGPAAAEVLTSLTGTTGQPRQARLCEIKHPASSDPLDRGLTLWFEGPSSFTGEDVAEFHIHGGRAVVAAVLDAILHHPGLRVAEPGEFTRRAFENGKLDLTEVEGLGDLLKAETEVQRRQAYAQHRGQLSSLADRFKTQLISILALTEATIDFPDEDDVARDALDEARRRSIHLRNDMQALLSDAHRGERLREGLVVALIGPPNAGKSTLFNALARRDVAIVSPIAGTTRDMLEVHLDLGGIPVILIDTAGLRETNDPIEREGVARTRKRLDAVDLALWLHVDAGAGAPPLAAPVWSIRTQIDKYPSVDKPSRHEISAVSGEGLPALLADIGRFASERLGGEPALASRARHRLALQEMISSLDQALALDAWDESVEIVADHMRSGIDALGRLIGRVTPDDVLGEIFSTFCIGK